MFDRDYSDCGYQDPTIWKRTFSDVGNGFLNKSFVRLIFGFNRLSMTARGKGGKGGRGIGKSGAKVYRKLRENILGITKV